MKPRIIGQKKTQEEDRLSELSLYVEIQPSACEILTFNLVGEKNLDTGNCYFFFLNIDDLFRIVLSKFEPKIINRC